MAIGLLQVLNDPAFQETDPILRAGAELVPAIKVRWVHSSEVMEIAPLLEGGELLLTGGTSLALASPEQRIHYIEGLAASKVAALAVETGGPLPDMPGDLVLAAKAAGLPLIELRKVAPFVHIAQTINSRLVSQSVALLRRADVLSQELASELADGGGLKQLVGLLAQRIPAGVAVLDPAGLPLERAAPDRSIPKLTDSAAVPLEIDISQRGRVAASLQLSLAADGDRAWAQAAGDRAVSILALALQERHPPSLTDVAGKELVRSIAAGVQGQRLAQLCRAAGIDSESPLAVLVGRPEGAGWRWAVIEQLVRKRAVKVVIYVNQQEMLVIAGLPKQGVRPARAALIAGLRAGLSGQPVMVSVGPVAAGVHEAARSMAEARLTLDLAPVGFGRDLVLDTEEFAIERLAARELEGAAAGQLIAEFVGELLQHDAVRGSRLVETLDAWLASGCNTAESARFLHLERQSMHNRLQKIFVLIGGDPRGTERLAGLHLATRLARHLQLVD